VEGYPHDQFCESSGNLKVSERDSPEYFKMVGMWALTMSCSTRWYSIELGTGRYKRSPQRRKHYRRCKMVL